MDYKKMASFEETSSTDELYIVALQNGENKKITADNLLAKLQSTLEELSDRICELEAPASETFYQGQWTTGGSSATMVQDDGDEDVLDVWRPALVECSDNSGETTTLHELNRLNWLRYKDGSFAPAVCITDDEYDECDGQDLYLNEGGNYYCAAGEFDAEQFYEDYGYDEKLYDSSGNEISHIRRPWETTSTDYSHVIANKVPLYLVDQVESSEDSTYTNKVILRTDEEDPFDGASYSEYKLPVTGMFASPFTTIDGKARSFFFDYCTGETNCVGGQGYCCSLFYRVGSYPRVADVHQGTCLTYSRANNDDSSLSYPFAEGGYLTHNIFCTCMELMAGTKYIIDPTNLWGSGISSDDSCSSESTWLANGGFRYKTSDASSYSYCTFGSTPSIYYDSSGSRAAVTYLLSSRYPLAQCEEGQIAFSLMQELSIEEGDEFEWNGGTWWWSSVSGVPSVSDGHMNVRVYKKIEDTISAYDSSGNACDYDIGVVLRFSLFEGLDLCGDIFGYCGGGLEMVGLGTGSGYTGRDETVDVYVQPDQKSWHSNSSTWSKADNGTFDFESSYTQIASSLAIVGDHWAKDRTSYSPWSQTSGGSKSTYECFNIWQNPYWDSTSNGEDRRYRLCARFRCIAYSGRCSPRFLDAGNAASYASVYTGGFAQCLGKWE